MKAPVAFGLVSFGVLAFACAPRGHSNESAAKAASAKAGEAPRIESALAIDVGDRRDDSHDVRFAFRVTNAGGGKVEVQFPSGQTHDVVVLDTLGREVWRWSDGRMFTQLMQNKTLRTADTLAYTERWRDAPPGDYIVVARLASATHPVEERARFTVR